MRRAGSIMTIMAGIFAAWVFEGASLNAQGSDSVDYELRKGSMILDDCLNCDRMAIQRPLQGTFRLVAGGIPGAPDLLLDVDFSDPTGDYTVKGTGTYRLSFEKVTTQELTLDVEVNGVSGVKLSSGVVEVSLPFPAIDGTATEPGDRDPLHMYSIRVVAAPKVKMVPYELEKGSVFVDDCTICGKPTVPIPITGTFLLGEIAGGPNPVSTYWVDAVDFQSTVVDSPYRIFGDGYYRQGGEVALLQEMRLELQVTDTQGTVIPGNILASTDPKVYATFPEIDIEILHQNPAGPMHVYSIHLIAKPSEGRFRRGDTNGDTTVDISDAVTMLMWLFSGGAPPGCMDAADSNADGDPDLSDAVYTLTFLFQGGDAPPLPGPTSCGPAPNPIRGCQSYPNC